MEEKLLTPSEYFNIVKERKHTVTEDDLDRIYDNCLDLLNKYKITGQKKAAKKLIFHLETIEKEKSVIDAGINTFIYRSDIEDYIDNVAKDVVKVIELENYERDIPEEIVEVLDKVKDIFDKVYIIFTDYTGKVERTVQKSKRNPDPILFGTFQDESSRTVIERFYYIGDWVDEYCDLTLDKMIDEMKTVRNKNIEHTIKTPEDIEELKKQLDGLKETDTIGYAMVNIPTNKSRVIDKIKTFLSRNK